MGLKIAQDVLEVLDRAEVNGDRLVLTGQLDRKLYTDVNKVLEAIGGKWNRSAKAHVFDMPVSDVLDPIMETGQYSRTKQDFGQFDSPPDVVSRVIHLAEIYPGMTVLEPSAGIGNLAGAAKRLGALVTTYEIDPKREAELRKVVNAVNVSDFLSATPTANWKFDRIVMNPPFAGQADIRHVLHAANFLKPDGILVSVMSAGVMFRENRKTVEFRQFVADHGGTIEKLPEGSFVASGTPINTCIVKLAA
jgi:predicted RNA methylase